MCLSAILLSSGTADLCPFLDWSLPSGSSIKVFQFRWIYVIPICLSMFGTWKCRLCILVLSWVFFVASAWVVGGSNLVFMCLGCGLEFLWLVCWLICFVTLSVGLGFGGYVPG